MSQEYKKNIHHKNSIPIQIIQFIVIIFLVRKTSRNKVISLSSKSKFILKFDRIGCRPPKSHPENLEKLSTCVREIQSKLKNSIVIIAGDFNLGDIDWINRAVKP